MARGGGQVTHVQLPQSTAPNPLAVFAQHISGIFPQLAQIQALEARNSASTTQQAIGQAGLDDREAANRQALAQLVAQSSSGTLPASAAAQVSSMFGGGLGDATQRVNMSQRLAEAPHALAGVKKARGLQTVLRDVDRKIAELDETAPADEGGRAVDQSILDPETRALQRSGLLSLRASLEAGDGENASNLAIMLSQAGLTGAGSIAMALSAEQIRGVRNQRQADEIAMSRLATMFPETYGRFAAEGVGSEGAAEALFALHKLSETEASERRLIGARESSERKLLNERAQLNRDAQAMAAYETLLTQAYSKTGSPNEALAVATRLLEQQNPELARTLRENGRLESVHQFVEQRFEAQGYAQSLLQRNAQVRTSTKEQRTLSVGSQRMPVSPLQEQMQIGQPERVQRRSQLNPESTEAAVRTHLQATLGVDPERASMIMESADIAGMIQRYNQGAIDAFNQPISAFESSRASGRQRSPELAVEERARIWERIIRERPTARPAPVSDGRGGGTF